MPIRLWGQELAVNTVTAGAQRSPSIAVLTNGDIVVVWEDAGVGNGDIKARLLKPDGTWRGDEFVISSSVSLEANPTVAALGDGGFHVVFEQSGALTTLTFNADGSPDGGALNEPLDASDPVAVGLNDLERALEVYTDGVDILIRALDATGVAGAPLLVEVTDEGAERDPDIALLRALPGETAEAVVVWRSGQPDIRLRRVDQTGQPLGAEDVLVASGATIPNEAPKVAALENGGYAVAWVGDSGGAMGRDIYVRTYDAFDQPLSIPKRVNTTLVGEQTNADIVGLPDGGFLVVWHSVDRVRAQRFDAESSRVGGEVPVGTGEGGTGDARSLSAALLPDGRVAVTWEVTDGLGDAAIRLQLLDPRDGMIEGTSAAETLYGSAYEDQIVAYGGDDFAYGRQGSDSIYGASGNDTLQGDAGDDSLFGDAGADRLYGGTGFDALEGGSGADFLYGNANDDVLVGGDGEDSLAGGDGVDDIDGGAGIDTLDLRDQSKGVSLTLAGSDMALVMGGTELIDRVRNVERVFAGSQSDVLTGDGGFNLLHGGGGNDTLSGQGGGDTLDGSTGVDFADYSEKTAAVVVTLNGAVNANVTIGGIVEDVIRNIEGVSGGSGGDMLTGDGLANTLAGRDGDDVLGGLNGTDKLYGENGDDLLEGGEGVDELSGGAGNDRLSGGAGNDLLAGGAGDDILNGGLGNDRLYGSEQGGDLGGIDTVDYSDRAVGISALMSASFYVRSLGGVNEDALYGIEAIWGTQVADIMTGSSGADVLRGGGGNDTLNGGAGVDALDYRDKAVAISMSLNGASASTVVVGSAVEDTVSNFENVYGGSAGDSLRGDANANQLFGEGGDDVLRGFGGADTLTGGDGADLFTFSAATDSTVASTGRDRVADFVRNQGDQIDLRGIDAIVGGADDPFTFGSFAAGTPGRVRIVTGAEAGTFVVEGDINGDAVADFAITVVIGVNMSVSDLLL